MVWVSLSPAEIQAMRAGRRATENIMVKFSLIARSIYEAAVLGFVVEVLKGINLSQSGSFHVYPIEDGR
jgi:hypothetical protein